MTCLAFSLRLRVGEQERLEMDGLMVLRVAQETLIEMLLCRGEIPTAHGDARQLEAGGVLPGGVPGRLCRTRHTPRPIATA